MSNQIYHLINETDKWKKYSWMPLAYLIYKIGIYYICIAYFVLMYIQPSSVDNVYCGYRPCCQTRWLKGTCIIYCK